MLCAPQRQRSSLVLSECALVDSVGIENASTLTKSSTYSRNRRLEGASWTFTLAPGPSDHPEARSESITDSLSRRKPG